MIRDRNPDDDTFSRFQPSERGRFGENEESRSGAAITGKSDLVDVAVVKFAETAKAVLVGETLDRDRAVWLPKSMIEIVSDGRPGFYTVTLPARMAKDKGLM